MKKSLLLIVLAIITLSISAQIQNNIWSLPPFYTNGFIPFSMPVNSYLGNNAEWAHNAMQDENGDLKFFIVDNEVFDNTGVTAGFLTNAGAMGPEIVIVPFPDDCDKFYIFYSISNANQQGGIRTEPYVAILDFTIPPPFVVSTTSLDNYTPTGSNFLIETDRNGFLTMAATELNINDERFIYVQLKTFPLK